MRRGSGAGVVLFLLPGCFGQFEGSTDATGSGGSDSASGTSSSSASAGTEASSSTASASASADDSSTSEGDGSSSSTDESSTTDPGSSTSSATSDGSTSETTGTSDVTSSSTDPTGPGTEESSTSDDESSSSSSDDGSTSTASSSSSDDGSSSTTDDSTTTATSSSSSSSSGSSSSTSTSSTSSTSSSSGSSSSTTSSDESTTGCDPDCSGLACGPDPVCGIVCGPCGSETCFDDQTFCARFLPTREEYGGVRTLLNSGFVIGFRIEVIPGGTLKYFGAWSDPNPSVPGSTSVDMRIGLYSDALDGTDNVPDELIASATFTMVDGRNEVVPNVEAPLASGAYWIVLLADEDAYLHAIDGTQVWAARSYSSGLPVNFDSITLNVSPGTLKEYNAYVIVD